MKQHFSVPSPCSEDWDSMTPTIKGAFCKKCTSEVHDLTNSPLSKIRLLLSESVNESICVRIKSSQLNALNDEVAAWYQPNPTFNHRLFLFSLFLVFGMSVFNGSAQTNQIAKQLQTTHQQIQETGGSVSDEINAQLRKNSDSSDHINQGSMVVIPATEKENPTNVNTPKTDISDALSDSPETIQFNISVYPNPTRSSATFQIDLPKNTSFAIKLFSISGNQVRSYGTMEFLGGSNEFTVDMEPLARGTYIMSFQSSEIGKAIRITKL